LGEGGVEELGENWGRVEESKRKKLFGVLYSPVFPSLLVKKSGINRN
jgi:hypothetical protein